MTCRKQRYSQCLPCFNVHHPQIDLFQLSTSGTFQERAIKGARDAVEKQEKEFEATEGKEQEKVELPPDKHENLN